MNFATLSPRDAGLFVILGSSRSVYAREVGWVDTEHESSAHLMEEEAPVFGI